MNKLFLLAATLLITLSSNAQKYQLLSPDGKLSAWVEIDRNINVDISKEGYEIISLSNISLETVSTPQPDSPIRVRRVIRRSVNEMVRPGIREKAAMLKNAYNELEIRFRPDLSVTFRLFDEGLAYRFATSSRDSLLIRRENLDIMFEESDSARFQSSKSFNSAYETPYEHEAASNIQQAKLCNLPFLTEKANGTFVMITEADLYDYPGLWFKGTGK
ncbi:MAG: glycoside hydrolase family 97 N-terminal domain-containing protein, partial [Bacteroidales bacterium]